MQQRSEGVDMQPPQGTNVAPTRSMFQVNQLYLATDEAGAEEAELLREKIDEHGYSVTTNANEATIEMLERASALVVLSTAGLSKHAQASRAVISANVLKKPIIPVWHSGRFPPEGGQVEDVLSALLYIPKGAKPLIQCGVSAIEIVVQELIGRLDLLEIYPNRWYLALGKALPGMDADLPNGLPIRTPTEMDLKQLLAELNLTLSGELRFRRMLDVIFTAAASNKDNNNSSQAAHSPDHFEWSSAHPQGNLTEAELNQPPVLSLLTVPTQPSEGRVEGAPRSMLSESISRIAPVRVSEGGGLACQISKAEMMHSFEGHTSGLRCLALAPDSSTLYSCGEDKSIRAWSVGAAGFQLLHTINEAHDGWIWSLHVSAHGKILFSGSGDKTIKMWELNPGEQSEPPRLAQTVTGHDDTVSALAICKQCQRLFSGSDDTTIRVWNISGGIEVAPTPLYILKGHTGYISTLCLNDDSSILVSGSMDSTLKVWHVGEPDSSAEPSSPRCYKRTASGGLGTTPLSPLGDFASQQGPLKSNLGSSSRPSSPRVGAQRPGGSSSKPPPSAISQALGRDSGAKSTTTTSQPFGIKSTGGSFTRPSAISLAFAKEGGAVSKGGSPPLSQGGLGQPNSEPVSPLTVAAVQYRLLATVTTHQAGVYTVVLSPCGRYLYSGGMDNVIRVHSIDKETGDCVQISVMEGHGRWVRSLRISKDGTTLVSSSADETICLWRVSDKGEGKMLTRLKGHTDRVRCVRISPDQSFLFSASADSTIRCWALT